jgi:Ca2+-binding RTX toxin-like protein
MRRTILLVATMILTLLVASGVALAINKIGTDGPDTLRGTNGDDNLLGKGANDVLYALGGRDNLLGDEGKDWLLTGERRALAGNKVSAGGPGNDGVTGGLGLDTLLGGSGNDFVFGDKGSDRVVAGGEGRDLIDGFTGSDRMLGEGGGDWLFDGPLDEASKNDVLSGGDGDDILFGDHVPAVRDIVTCGGGFDRAVVDRKDVVADDCEEVRVVHGSFEEVLEQEDAFFESLPPGVREFFDTFFEEQLAPFPNA